MSLLPSASHHFSMPDVPDRSLDRFGAFLGDQELFPADIKQLFFILVFG